MAKSNYSIKYLPSFDRELTEILYYITFELKNKNAAERLLNNIKQKIEKIKRQKELLGKLQIGDLVWAKMPLSKKEYCIVIVL